MLRILWGSPGVWPKWRGMWHVPVCEAWNPSPALATVQCAALWGEPLDALAPGGASGSPEGNSTKMGHLGSPSPPTPLPVVGPLWWGGDSNTVSVLEGATCFCRGGLGHWDPHSQEIESRPGHHFHTPRQLFTSLASKKDFVQIF